MGYRGNTPECVGVGTASPNWCFDIPESSRQYSPACANVANRVPDWCYSIPVDDRSVNPTCAGAGSTKIPPEVQETVCHVVPAFVLPIVGPIIGCSGSRTAGITLPFVEANASAGSDPNGPELSASCER